jgi:hypothetical protein
MALTRQDCGFEHQTASQAICAIERERRQNSDWNGNRTGVLDARLCRKSWIYS